MLVIKKVLENRMTMKIHNTSQNAVTSNNTGTYCHLKMYGQVNAVNIHRKNVSHYHTGLKKL